MSLSTRKPQKWFGIVPRQTDLARARAEQFFSNGRGASAGRKIGSNPVVERLAQKAGPQKERGAVRLPFPISVCQAQWMLNR